MYRNSLAGLLGWHRYRKVPNLPTATDLVDRRVRSMSSRGCLELLCARCAQLSNCMTIVEDDQEGSLTPERERAAKMTNSERSTIKSLSDAEQQMAINKALEAAGCGLEDLREQARRGRFTSDVARSAWFVVSALG